MASKVLQSFARAAALVGIVSAALASPSQAERPVRRTTRPTAARGFNLFAGSVNVVMNVNRVQCNINNIGESCVDPTNSPSLGGGFWPKGSPDQYIFNSGLQIAGIIPGAKTATFPWPGDTVGAFFFDPRGDQAHGEGRTNVFNALNADDIAGWPTAANINDTSLFNSALIGRQTVSQQDTWVRFWDGNTNLSNGRQHPMGILVEQRGLAWNFPSGNQDIVYFLSRFINITTTDPAKYAGLADYGYSAQDISDIVAIANEFQQRSEAAYNIQIPDTGFTWSNLFASFAQDPDVGQAGQNYSNANLVFNIAMAYKSDFLEPTWQFPSDIFSAPLARAPGFEGVKYLKSPQNIGIAMSGNTTNGAPFPDAVGVQRLWRNLSGNLLASDGTCSVTQPQTRRMCYWAQAPADTRFFESSGPFTMNPGETAVIVVAYIHAAPVASAPAVTPGVGRAIPAYSLSPFIGGNMVPGFAIEGQRLALSQDTIRNLDRAAGWITHADLDGDGIVEQCTRDQGVNNTSGGPTLGVGPCVPEVTTTPRSLFNKALVAQAVFDAKFLLPFAPEVPAFFLVPGDNQVTVAWQPSATETIGDPYFNIASNPASVLYDPNFRKFDVEGYRIWRGRTQSEMQVIAAFDYAGTTIADYTAAFVTTDNGSQCAPELGLTTSCAVAFDVNPVVGTSPHLDMPLSGDVIQVPPGGRVELAPPGSPNTARGNVLVTVSDTAVVGGGSGLPALQDTGVPFAYVDRGVINGFRYFYSVTAFDVNSVKSGPSSLESPLVTKTVTPRAPSTNNQPAVVVTGLFGGDGTQLDPTAPMPSIDAANGTFNGPIPPANSGSFGFLASVAEALPPGEYVARIDSMAAGFIGGIGEGPKLYMTFIAGTDTIPQVIDLESGGASTLPAFNAPATTETEFSTSLPLVPYDTMRARLLGIPLSFSGNAKMPVNFSSAVGSINAMSMGTALSQGRYGVGDQPSRFLSHSRWFDETAGSEPADPTIDNRPSKAHNSGSLTGVDSIWAPTLYRVPTGAGSTVRMNVNFRGYIYALTSWYPADFVVTWGAGGAVTVRDSTHRTDLPYNKGMGTGYGFYSITNATAAGMNAGTITDGTGTPSLTAVSYQHLYTIDPVCRPTWWNDACADLKQTAEMEPLDFNSDGTADGNGIVMVINEEPFFFKMAALPAAGTKWHLRAVGGRGMGASCTPALPGGTSDLITPPTDCSNYTFSPVQPHRFALAPGLQYKIVVSQAFGITANSGDLSNVHTVPDPYYVTNSLEITANTKVLRFVNLPNQAVIRIYSASGILVQVLNHNSQGGGGEATWNLRNRNNQFVASGVYFYHVEGPDGKTKIGRFTVVNYAQ